MDEERVIYTRILKRIMERRVAALFNYEMELRDALETVKHLEGLVKTTKEDIASAEKELGVDGDE